MASKITMRTRVDDATAPTAGASGDLSVGELAINSFAGKLYGGVHIGATTAAGTQASGATAAVLSWHGLEIDAFTDGTAITVAGTDKLLLLDGDGTEKYILTSQLGTYLGSGDIEGVTAGDGLSGGGTTGTVTVDLDLNELTAASVDVANDSFAIIDANASNDNKKESLADYASAIAGDGLGTTAGVINIIAGTGIDVAANEISVDPSDFISNGSSNKVVVATGADAFAAQDGFEWDPIFGGEASDYRYLKLLASGSKTATPQRVLALKADTSGTVAAGFGTGLMFMMEQPTDGVHQAGAIDVTWEGVVDGSEAAQMEFFLETGGTEISQTGADSQVMLLSSGGNLQIDGDMTVSGGKVTLTNGSTIDSESAGNLHLKETTIEVGNADATANIKSSGDYDLVLKTGNSSTSDITITDGANGAITLTTGSGATTVGNLTVNSTALFNGHVTIGNAAADDLTITADIASHMQPSADSTYDLGDSSTYWRAGYIDAITTTGDITVGGGLTVNGTTTTVNSTTMTVDDPIITLGGDSAPGSDDNKDRGVEFRYHDGSSARVGFFGWDDSATGFTGLSAATNTSEVFSGTVMNATFGNIAGTLTTVAQTAITSVGTLTGLTMGGTLDMGDNSVTNVGDINCDSISIDNASVGLTIDFSGSQTSKAEILLSDNVQRALEFKQGSNEYIGIDTRDGAELIVIAQELDINAVSDFGSNAMTNVNIDSGAIDGTAIGANSAAAGTFGALVCTTQSLGGKLTAGSNEIEGSAFDINGGNIDGTTIGAASAAAATITTLNITSMGSNWTNASRTIADLGVVTTVDINGGTLDNVTIAESTINGGTF